MFDRFRSSDDKPEPEAEPEPIEEDEPEPDEQEEEDETEEIEVPTPPTVTLVEEYERSFEYTEHEATAGFSDGTTRDFTFDKMNETSAAYVLSDYNGFRYYRGSLRPKGSRKTATLVKRNLNFFETTNRIQREETEEVHNEHQAPLPEAMYYAEQKPDKFSFDEDEVSDEELEQWEPMRHFDEEQIRESMRKD